MSPALKLYLNLRKSGKILPQSREGGIMELKEAIMTRKSIRGFKEEPVSKEVLRDVLTLACRAVSALNSQPWNFAVITGDIKEKIGEENVACYIKGAAEDVEDPVLDGKYKTRRVAIAKQLFKEMDIARENVEKREWWTRRGFKFFDAPAAILIYMDEELDIEHNIFNIGCVVQNICLAAMEYGLGTCVELQAVNYLEGVRKYLDIPKEKNFVIGIAIGYPDDEFPANKVITEREDIDDITKWYGFE